MTLPSAHVVAAWVALLRAHRTALGGVEAALKAAGLPHLEWYDVLLELERAGPLRPRDLQARLLLAQSNLSRLLDRMEAAKLVETHPCDDDRRGTMVASTRAGKTMRQQMWPVYAKAINAAVGKHLNAADAEQLCGLLNLLVRSADVG